MTQQTASELTVVETLPIPEFDPNAKQSRAAIKRCCAAWQRAFDEYLKSTSEDDFDETDAYDLAAPAYRRAMPPLSGYENIRDFIACAAHGILIEAIPDSRANQLLYAAQVALSSLHFEPKERKSG